MPAGVTGYRWELSMRQVEVSRTLVYDAPVTPADSSKPWSPTTSTSAAPTLWNSFSMGPTGTKHLLTKPIGNQIRPYDVERHSVWGSPRHCG
ncbi:hypothetical protein [Mycobacterium riyadhense]|uniref:hypothetical protein n=1 Tax=Mycobacterium riyadhense TaxID=486698 RepID=UPI001958003B|nr:hypothetical protein [Mycobacterium riyadhense]